MGCEVEHGSETRRHPVDSGRRDVRGGESDALRAGIPTALPESASCLSDFSFWCSRRNASCFAMLMVHCMRTSARAAKAIFSRIESDRSRISSLSSCDSFDIRRWRGDVGDPDSSELDPSSIEAGSVLCRLGELGNCCLFAKSPPAMCEVKGCPSSVTQGHPLQSGWLAFDLKSCSARMCQGM